MRPPAPRPSSAVRAALLQCALVVAGCAGSGGGGAAAAARAPMDAELFPCVATSSVYRLADGTEREVSVSPTTTGAVIRVGPGGGMDVLREGTGVVFRSGPESWAELIRDGARPGDSWESGGTRVRFDGWDRISVPAGTFDAARVRAVSGPAPLEVVQTWWFARGVGLVRLRSDRGGLFADEMSLVR